MKLELINNLDIEKFQIKVNIRDLIYGFLRFSYIFLHSWGNKKFFYYGITREDARFFYFFIDKKQLYIPKKMFFIIKELTLMKLI